MPDLMKLLSLIMLFLSAGFMAYADIRTGKIPGRALCAAILATGLYKGPTEGPFPGTLLYGLVRGILFTLPLFLFVLLYERVRKKKSFGGGDLKMILVLSAHFSYAINLFGLLFSAGFGFVFGLLYRRLSKEKRLFPLAPALMLGWLLAAILDYRRIL